jgi:CO/xanthine dehydrogenase Mo-binding subunit
MLPAMAALLFAAVGTGADQGNTDRVTELARKALAEELGIDAETIRVRTVEAVEWPDASLGCPKKGQQYAQVVTPGHRVLLEADGRTYAVHVAGNKALTCRGSAVEPHIVAAARLAELARADLAARLKMDPQAVKTRLLRPQSWPDASLGCPKPDVSYAQVVTRGFLIELETGGKVYRYHSDLKRVVPCDGPER